MRQLLNDPDINSIQLLLLKKSQSVAIEIIHVLFPERINSDRMSFNPKIYSFIEFRTKLYTFNQHLEISE